MKELWVAVHAARRALADDLARLRPEQWGTPSLCDGWDVHDVVAHLVSGAQQTRWGFLAAMARARFDFDREVASGVAAERRADPALTLAAFRAVCDSTTTPPAPLITRTEEAVIHAEDIRRPLGIRHDYPPHWVARAVEHQARDRLAGGRARVAGVELCADDCGLRVGGGPKVRGPVLSLLLVASGRAAALADCDGPGMDVLAERLVR
ncbi:maleylpyruvate isomerase family mycothiol-dependent enzyme [Mycolicibacterium sp. S2-37]|uniref:maleylpyruvate isomerase family mycothiol-dependent enzyme n=1 Tax=Mycolicibacterium sp. S2-37 TaxID=2810297 RepID=UPI001A948D5E|nr:maleylpyruvate isomerase family mycothiol-dependent enzyme [Mycolicibacterium sp. S2-37]MBO0679830.1 maleylpyruvate isomerase family mycothiol-dependent enzyme [Mycolicibacterium sp. S2-37]MBO0681227.1 maleylpyruvate isomerase family mycothiol-dependent enzyme [Mycolicibacterium sp. S2-37]